eukprot:3643265-Rhodomonas_salina.1
MCIRDSQYTSQVPETQLAHLLPRCAGLTWDARGLQIKGDREKGIFSDLPEEIMCGAALRP